MDRTQPLAADLDWLPRRARVMRWAVAGSVWAGTGLAVAGIVAAAPFAAASLWKVLGLASVGGAVLGERAGRMAYHQHARKLARGQVDLAALGEREEGELVHVRGRIEAERLLSGVLHDTPGVFRRVVFALGIRKWVHEAAVDFALVNAEGERVFVHAAGARLLVPMAELVDYPARRFAAVPPSRALGGPEAFAGREVIQAAEYVLPISAEVEVIGHKTVTPDPTGGIDVGDYRLPPQRATLRSGKVLPLLITPAGPDGSSMP